MGEHRPVGPSTDVLLLSDGGPVARAIEDTLRDRGAPCRVVAAGAPRDQVMDQVLGCRALVAVGAANRLEDLCAAAGMPGVRGLVLVVSEGETPELAPLKRSGVPYAVLRPAPLLEALVQDLAPILARGTLLLSRDAEPAISWVAARDVARCAVAAIDADDACGRVIDVASPERLLLGELASRVAAGRGTALEVRRLPRWAVRAMRLLGRRPFVLADERVQQVDGTDAGPLLDGRWSRLEEVVAARPEERSLAVS